MANLTTRIIKRGFEWFAVLSVVVMVAIMFYGDNFDAFVQTMVSLEPGWFALMFVLASLDWIGGGLRLWVVTRHIHPKLSLKGMILAGGMNNWASHLTPSQTGGGPMMIWVMKRYGVPYPEATTSAIITFIATVIFFAIVGPLALIFGAGQSLREHGVLLGVTLLDLFRASLLAFVGIGVVVTAVMVFPRRASTLLKWIAKRAGARHPKWEARAQSLLEGIDRGHECMVAFFRGSGWIALLGGIVLTALAHANKLIAGYVVLRALGIHAHFIDVLLLQTLITFLLYFAPTPGGSGMAEILAAAVMSIYVPREQLPSYAILWRFTVSYLTVGFGAYVFWRLLRDQVGGPAAKALDDVRFV